jgi:hypothetical protein
MAFNSIKTILVLVFSIILLTLSYNVVAQENETKISEKHEIEEKEKFDAKQVILAI